MYTQNPNTVKSENCGEKVSGPSLKTSNEHACQVKIQQSWEASNQKGKKNQYDQYNQKDQQYTTAGMSAKNSQQQQYKQNFAHSGAGHTLQQSQFNSQDYQRNNNSNKRSPQRFQSDPIGAQPQPQFSLKSDYIQTQQKKQDQMQDDLNQQSDASGYRFESERCGRSGSQKFKLFKMKKPVLFSEFAEELAKKNVQLIDELTKNIKNFGQPVFWECMPVSASNFSEIPFEFVLTPAGFQHSQEPDFYSFQDQFDKSYQEDVINFKNLGRDAELVVPSPISEDLNHYTHLSSFLANGDKPQIENLWQRVGQVWWNHIETSNKPVWVSTAGMGVFWLHVRFDSRPKYYQWAEYKNMHE